MGLGVPRPALRLVQDGQSVRVVTKNTGEDRTELARRTVARLVSGRHDWDGFILKKSSPSCGLERVKVYPGGDRAPTPSGRGVFAAKLVELNPTLPLIEEGRLTDPAQREQFVLRVFAHRRLAEVRASMPAIQAFHRHYKLVLMERSPAHYRKLGAIVGNARRKKPGEVLEEYRPLFLEALQVPATPGKRVNVLHHIVGYFRDRLDRNERSQVLEAIEEYKDGIVPFVAPMKLLQHLVRKLSVEYLEGQLFFEPYPKALGLRNRT